jgi:predicted Zn-dependent peptidase
VADRLVARADAIEHAHGRDRRDAVTDQQDFQTVPKLELALRLEADRMRNSLIADEDRQSEMTVVRNELERGQNVAA